MRWSLLLFALVIGARTSAWAGTESVTNTNGDSSSGSLGAALGNAASDTTGSDTFAFTSLFNSPQSINLSASYGTISKSAGESLTIDPSALLTISNTIFGGFAFSGGGNFYLTNLSLSGEPITADPSLSVSGGSTAFLTNVSLLGDMVLNQGALDFLTGVTTTANVALTGTNTINVASGQTSTFSGAFSGSGSLIADGPGTLAFSNNFNAYSGGIQIDEGTVAVSNTANVLGTGTVALNASGTLSVQSAFLTQSGALSAGGGTLTLGSSGTTQFSSLSRVAGGGLVIIPNASGTTAGTPVHVTFGSAPAMTNGIVDASIVAANSATDTSADFLTFNPAAGLERATYSTATQITNGGASGTTSASVFHATSSTNNSVGTATTLYALKVDSGVTVNGALTLGDGTHTAGLIINGGTSSAPTTINGTIAFATGSEGAVYVGGNGSADYAKILVVDGSNGLTKNGNGFLELAVAGYTGTTTINEGTLQIDDENSFAPGVAAGSTINLSGTLVYSGAAFTSGLAGTINLNADGTLASIAGNVLTLNGTINGNDHMLTLGAASLGTNDIFQLGGTVSNISSLDLAAGTTEITGTIGSASTPIAMSANNVVLGVEVNTTVANPISMTGGDIDDSATVTFSGPIAINAGVIQNGSEAKNGIDARAGDTLTLSGQITGNGMLSIGGAGNVLITGSSSTFSGNIITDATSLDISGNLPGAQVVDAGLPTAIGKLSGTGTVGALSLSQNGQLHPGELGAIGTFTASSLAWLSDGTGQMQFQLSDTSNISSLLNLGSGAFTNAGGSAFVFDFLGTGEAGQDYDLINFGAGNTNFTASDFTATDLASGLTATFSFVTNGNTESLMADVVPEPNVSEMLVVGLVALAGLVRRRLDAESSLG